MYDRCNLRSETQALGKDIEFKSLYDTVVIKINLSLDAGEGCIA